MTSQNVGKEEEKRYNMGGRGASSGGGGSLPTVHPSGGGGSSGEWSKGLGFQNYDTLKDAIGKKGKPMSIYEAASGANPHYDRSGTYREFNENCQRSVVAYEARRRGYDVTAQPTYQGDKMPYGVHGNGRWQGAFQHAKRQDVSGSTPSSARRRLESQMASYGDGARAVMSVKWKGETYGHVLNVEYHKGRTSYIDGQTGAKYIAGELFHSIDTKRVGLVRVDNLRFSDRAKNMITKDKW